jgi:hypothetical protein
MMMRRQRDVFIIGLLPCLFSLSLASTPNVIVSVGGSDYMAKRGLFGSKEDVTGELVLAPESDPLLCNYNGTQEATPLSTDSIMLVPRGACSFEQKAYAAKQLFGVVGVFIYDNMAARYGWDEEAERVIFPLERDDYECANGYGTMENLDLDLPKYNATVLDSVLSEGCTLTPTRKPCESNICMVTGHSKDSADYPVCCAWDLPKTMGGDDTMNDALTDDVVAIFLTIRQASEIVPLAAAVGVGGGAVGSSVARARSNFNVSFLFLWLMGVFTTVFGSWYAAQEYRDFGTKLDEYKAKQGASENGPDNDFAISDDDAGIDDLESEGGKEGSFKDEVDDSGRGNMFGWAKKFGRGGKDERPMSLRSIPPARYTEKKEAEKESGKQDDGSWVQNAPDNDFAISDDDAGIDDLQSEGGKEISFKDEVDDWGRGNMFGWAKKFGRGGKDEEPMSLRSISPARYTEKKEPEKKIGEQDDGSWVLYSLPPRKKGNKKKTAATPEDNAIDMATQEVTTQTRAQKSGDDLDSFIPEGSSAASMSSELSQWHIFGFVASASIMLVLLFYFRFFAFLFVLYALGCAGAVAYLIVGPILVRTVPKLGDEVVTELNKEVCCRQNGFDVASQMGGFIWAGIWIWYGMAHYQPLRNWFFWITQDIFGCVVSIMFLGALKLYSIRIATWFLVAVFFYDIFFVFITPFMTSNGESIMLAVVGDSDTPIDDICYKYSDSSECTGVTSLPMILTIPHVNDWTGGSAILGLGDILRKSYCRVCNIRNTLRPLAQ